MGALKRYKHFAFIIILAALIYFCNNNKKFREIRILETYPPFSKIFFFFPYRVAAGTIGITFLLGLYILYRNPDANWGSSAQGQTFVSAVKSVHQVTETPDHVKNYRPKILCLTGNPAHRPALVDFANLITKKVSLLICADVLTDMRPINVSMLKVIV